MNLDLVKLLLNGLSVLPLVASAFLVNAFFQAKAEKEKFLTLFLAIVGWGIPLQVSDALKDPQSNSSTFLLVAGYVYFIGSLIIVFKIAEPEPKEDDRTKILGFVREEVTNRLQAMGVSDQQISVRAKPKEGTTTNLLQVLQNLPGGEFMASKVKVMVDRIEQVIPPGTRIIDTFNQEAAKKLLILGAPGSGKTTALLTLARQLHEAAEQNKSKPIPIVLELSSWQPSEEIPDWIALQLKSKYQLSEPRCKQFLKRGEFVLLLDGLDELKDNKDACIDAINKFRTNYVDESQKLVVCSRLIDYEEATQKLDIPGCYALQPLSDGEIESYLTTHKVSHLWKTIKTDKKGFLELARQPLLLDLIRKTYTDGLLSFPELTTNSDLEQYKKDCQERLLADYVEHQLEENHNHRGYDRRKTKHYLEWLAQNLKRQKTTEFLLENMQPSWLEPHRQKGYRLAISLIEGLIVGMILGMILGVIYWLIVGMILGLIYGLIRRQSNIKPYEVLNLNLFSINTNKLIGWLIGGIIVALIYGLIPGLILGLILGLMIGDLILGLIVGLIAGLIPGLILGLTGGLILRLEGSLRLRDKPNQGIWNSGQNAIILTGLSCLFIVVLYYLTRFVPNPLIDILPVLQNSLGIIPMSIIFFGGGIPFIQHFVLRYFLIRAEHIPKDYVGFLKYAEERGLILQNGGSFRFYHDLLREHLAGDV